VDTISAAEVRLEEDVVPQCACARPVAACVAGPVNETDSNNDRECSPSVTAVLESEL
jgi:hypothetical protein